MICTAPDRTITLAQRCCPISGSEVVRHALFILLGKDVGSRRAFEAATDEALVDVIGLWPPARQGLNYKLYVGCYGNSRTLLTVAQCSFSEKSCPDFFARPRKSDSSIPILTPTNHDLQPRDQKAVLMKCVDHLIQTDRHSSMSIDTRYEFMHAMVMYAQQVFDESCRALPGYQLVVVMTNLTSNYINGQV